MTSEIRGEQSAGRHCESRRRRLVRWLLAPLVAWPLRALAWTWRVESLGEDPFQKPVRGPILAATWHANVLAAASVFRDSGVVVPVSRSRDGSNITAVMRHLGLGEPPRGSNSQGGTTALRSLVHALRAGGSVVMTVDGPKGPERVAKLGIVAAARLSGLPILLVAVVARPRIRFGSWDRTQLPLPFARVVVGWAQLMPVDSNATDAEQEALRVDLGKRLESLRDVCQARLEQRS